MQDDQRADLDAKGNPQYIAVIYDIVRNDAGCRQWQIAGVR